MLRFAECGHLAASRGITLKAGKLDLFRRSDLLNTASTGVGFSEPGSHQQFLSMDHRVAGIHK